jgi:predicted metal-dependent hydrolase
MGKIKLMIPKSNEEIEIDISRKKMKNVRLKVFPNGGVAISVPHDVSLEWINKYLKDKSGWVKEKLDSFEKTAGIESIRYIKSGISTKIFGISTKIFGRQVIIIVKKLKKKRVYRDEDIIYIHTPDKKNENIMNKQLEKWIRGRSKIVYEKIVDRLFPIIEKYGYERPGIHIRKMKTRWGSSNKEKEHVTLNFYLYKALTPCIEYIVLHELVHFLYPKHNKEFYNFLSIYMPDWKERKKILDYEVVQGI